MDKRIPEIIAPEKPPSPGGNREKLLWAALACLRDRGYAHTTARDLVAASGTNLNSIGYHFGGKDQLLHEAIAMGFDAWTAEVERNAFADDEASGAERLERALAEMIDRFDELRPFLVAFAEAFPPAARNPELRGRMARAYADCRAVARRLILRAAADDGVELTETQATTLSSLMLAVQDGLILQYLLDPTQTPSSRELMDALLVAARVVR